MRDVYAEDMSHGRGFDNPFYFLIAFAGTSELSYQQLVEILQELESFPPPPLLRESVQPIYRWSKALPGADGIRAEDLSCLLYTSPSPRDRQKSRMPSSA